MLYAPEHPNVNANGAILAHRYVASQALGRALEKHERVHHKFPGRRGEWPEPNELEVWATDHPSGFRVVDVMDAARRELAADLRARIERRALHNLRRLPARWRLTLADLDRDALWFTARDLQAALRVHKDAA